SSDLGYYERRTGSCPAQRDSDCESLASPETCGAQEQSGRDWRRGESEDSAWVSAWYRHHCKQLSLVQRQTPALRPGHGRSSRGDGDPMAKWHHSEAAECAQ